MATFAPPQISGLGTRGGCAERVWAAAWNELRGGGWLEAAALAARIGPPNGLKPESALKLLSQIHRGGLLDREYRLASVMVTRKGVEFPSRRQRVWYRVKGN